MQQFIVILIGVIVFGFVFYKTYGAVKMRSGSKGPTCGCGQDNCSSVK